MFNFLRLKEKYHIIEDFDDMDYYDDDDWDDDGPGPGCRACGNPDWPDCEYSCPMYDD